MDNKPLVTEKEIFISQIADIAKDVGKLNVWLSFMFENEPIADYIRSFCKQFGIVDEKMYQLIALSLMQQKSERLLEEWQNSQKPKILLLKT